MPAHTAAETDKNPIEVVPLVPSAPIAPSSVAASAIGVPLAGTQTPESVEADSGQTAPVDRLRPADLAAPRSEASGTSAAVPATAPTPAVPQTPQTLEPRRSQPSPAIASARRDAEARDRELTEIRQQQEENDSRQTKLQREAADLSYPHSSPIAYYIRRVAIDLDLRIARARAVGLSKEQLESRDRLRASREKLGDLEEQEIASRSRSENVPQSIARAMLSGEAGRAVGNRRETYRAAHPSAMTPQAFLRAVDAADRAIADTSQNDGGDSDDATTAKTLQNLGMLPGTSGGV